LSYIDRLIEDGTHFRVERRDGSASFRPAGGSDDELEQFQSVVRNLRDHRGDGYDIHLEHKMSDRPGDLVDLVLVTINE
jgi:hypothetical protein